MHVPRFWEKESIQGTDSSGQKINVGCWGWSESSRDEAKSKAIEAAWRVLNYLHNNDEIPGQYGYDERLPREEILDEFPDRDGQTRAFVSRNSYGALILNTRDLMFIDIDLPPKKKANAIGFLASLFGKKPEPVVDPAEQILAEIQHTAREFSDCGFRVYRTFNGFRLMVANQPITADSAVANEILNRFKSDPLYVRMCKNQQCYRARLTPKAWRCKVPMPPTRFPFATAADESAFRQWADSYTEASKSFCTCNLVEIIGSAAVHAELGELVQLHDDLTKTQIDATLA